MISDYPEDKQLRVAFYIRVSTDDQVDKYGIDAQLSSLKSMIASSGTLSDGITAKMILAGEQYIYKDLNVSGATELNERPAFSKLREDLEYSKDGSRLFDVVAVYRIDRFARKLKILLDIVDYFKSQKIDFISVNESIDTSTFCRSNRVICTR